MAPVTMRLWGPFFRPSKATFSTVALMVVRIAIQIAESYDSTIQRVDSDSDSMAWIGNARSWLNRVQNLIIVESARFYDSNFSPTLFLPSSSSVD
ncbi:hypothetical protein CDL15_Pgr013349 [Punica granatum]|uniref:Uncharacterized protein n=1 Tax=Punica granatum TaxID=22663 RepID=A0A218WNT8_PUNGR|nr:hypothetical protein CDL15_Pgr013349 [Punica granatum]